MTNKARKIGLNARNLGQEPFAGPERYTINVYKSLALADEINDYYVFFDKEPDEVLWETISNNNSRWKKVVLQKSFLWTHYWLEREVTRLQLDVFFTPLHTLPIVRNAGTKYMVVMHGVDYQYSQRYRNLLTRPLAGIPERLAIRHADVIITPSEFSKQQVLDTGLAVNRRIEVVPEGLDQKLKAYAPDKGVFSKHNITGQDYILAVSTLQPRKNYLTLIRAFHKLRHEHPEHKNLQLVIAGKFGWEYEDILDEPRKLGMKEVVTFTGAVGDAELAALYTNAKLYVNVSLEEGFGLPVLEAMSFKLPIVVSDIKVFKELFSGAVLFTSKNSVQEAAETMHSALTQYPNELFIHAQKYLEVYTWENTAKRLLELFR